MEKPEITVCIGGHFNPLHEGHLELIKAAKKLGTKLIVIVANDIQAGLKRPRVFIPEEKRMEIMRNIKGVDDVVLSIDTDTNLCKTLAEVKPDIFASGCGEDHPDAIEEQKVCFELGIETVYDVGGEKINSSSKILEKYTS